MTQEQSLKFVCEIEDAYGEDTGRKIKMLQSNNGGEYTSDLFLQLCQNEDIERHHSSKNTTIEWSG